MSAKKNRDAQGEAEMNDDSEETTAGQSVTDMLKTIDVGPWLDRATEMLQARPAVTIGAAMGAGFVLGLTLFSKLGRVALIGALGLGTEVLMQKLRAGAGASA